MHSVVQQQQEVKDSGEYGAMDSGDSIEDAKFYQDAAIEYQSAYKALWSQQEELQSRFTQQVLLIKEASGALKAAESEAPKCHQELVNVQQSCDTDIQSAVNSAVSKYQAQLS